MDRLFGSMDNVIWKEDGIALLDEDLVYIWPADEKDDEAEMSGDRLSRLQAILASSRETEPAPRDQGMVFSYQRNESACCLDMKINDQRYAFVTGLDRRAMLADRMTFLSVYFAVFILLIPLLIATFYFFYSNINKPISTLVEGSEKIRSGLYGSQVEPFTKNQEIGQLVDRSTPRRLRGETPP